MSEAMIPREQLEREVRSLRLRLDYCIDAAKTARTAFQVLVPDDRKSLRSYQIHYAIFKALAKENAMVGPLLSAVGYQRGMEVASKIAEEMAGKGGEEWKAACMAVAEKLRQSSGSGSNGPIEG